MTDLVYDYITMGVDMIISAAVLASIVILLRGATVLSQYSAVQQENADRVNYYKEYNKYDNTNQLTSADAKSAILYYRYDIQILIKISGNVYIKNDVKTGNIMGTTNGTTYSTISSDELSDPHSTFYLNPMYTFSGKLFEDGKNTPSDYYNGGAITGIQFIKN